MSKITLLVAILCFAASNYAAAAAPSLQSLLDTEVTSVSKAPERAFDAAAAIYVITKDDIKRSGATSIPEVLRLAPGVQVAQAGSNKWAISIRGFNDQFSNKLLVLIDGRSVYTPLFSGVYWDTQDTLIEDIKQIEIIRGPGATLWGANAVNGVINIITEEAVNTKGYYANAIVGNGEQSLAARRGGEIKNKGNYRTYAKYFNKNEVSKTDGYNNQDAWSMAQGGIRWDSGKVSSDFITIQGDVYSGRADQDVRLPVSTSSTAVSRLDTDEDKGGNVMLRWNHALNDGSNVTMQTYLDYTDRNVVYLKQQHLTYDLDVQHNLKPMHSNEFTYGIGYRMVTDDLSGTQYLSYNPAQRTDNLYSAFIQDKITLFPKKLFLTLGSKFEHNNYTGFESQPSARVAYTPTPDQTLWASVAKAVRVPNRNMEDVTFAAAGTPGGFFILTGNRDAESEELVAYETGYRVNATRSLSFDVAAFYNDYDKLTATKTLTALSATNANLNNARTYGFEISSKWKVTQSWYLAGNYTQMRMNLNSVSGSSVTTTGKTPQHQYSVSSHLDLPYNLQLDNYLYFVDTLLSGPVDKYRRFDTRLNWHPNKHWEFSLVGQNLFDKRHQEFGSFIYSSPVEIGRTAYISATLHY